MKNKSLNLFAVSILSLIFLISLVSATITFSSVPTLSQTGNSATINIKSDKNETLTALSFSDIIQGSNTITFTYSPLVPITLVSGTPQTININYTIPPGFNFDFAKDYSTILNASGNISSAATQKISFAESSFCEFNNVGNDLSLDVEINNVDGFGENDDEWYLLDKIEVDITVENNGDSDINNIEISWGLYDPDNSEWIIEESEKDFDLKNGKDEKVKLSFQINPDDINDENQENYIFFVKATAEVEDSGLDTCVSDDQPTTLFIDDDFVVLNNIKFNPETVQCGSEVEVTADVWNIGADDQNEVSVIIYNPSLGLNNQKIEIGDIDMLDKEKLSFKFNIPEDAAEKSHTIELRVLDDNDDVYENDNDQAVFTSSLKVEGSCGVEQNSVLIAASLESGGKAGENLVVKATLTNTGTKLQTFSIKASGYSDWASSADINEPSFALGAGESKSILITLNVKSDASGDKTFNIEALSKEQLLLSQPVSVSVTKGFNFKGIPGITADNWYLWAIGALNIILVIIIIVVAVRVARK